MCVCVCVCVCHNAFSRHGLQEPATLMLDVCLCFRSRLNAGEYSDMCHVLNEPWQALQTGGKTAWSTRSCEQDGDDSELELEQRSKRLSLDDILKHFRTHGARGTFLASVTSRVLSDGRQATLLYVLPKYRLELGTNRREDLAAALKLGLATTVQQVHEACADPDTGPHDSRNPGSAFLVTQPNDHVLLK